MESSQKICSLEDAAAHAARLRAEGKKVVTTNGVFDLLCVPHLLLLEKAASLGGILFVGVNSDQSVRALKGDKRPILPCVERQMLVAGIGCTGYVFSFDETDPRSWLQQIRPHVHVNSSEYTENCIEASTVYEIGAELVLYPRAEGFLSTSDVVERICDRYC
ncbi:D-glycero-beta-D-manno-heptose 1-phosphate adenylyltransferase [Candidatus Peregrinibacteria bacterium CG10_big_fil_rev_8_21_14_0_10_49_10]|nr:MAG: D-glycero-beta-D-manno-heptose 1-phosphate adenylyltransferase [Candidatus Peregrinibacteria bacterium CG10_big_fil_rev_8_21_14_0_10_49_10]